MNDKFLAIASARSGNCGIRVDNSVLCWHTFDNTEQEFPNLDTTRLLTIDAGVSAAKDRYCGIQTDGKVACWGPSDFEIPRSLRNMHFLTVTAGGQHNCALLIDRRVTCWGAETDQAQNSVPQDLAALRFWAITAGEKHNCGIKMVGDTPTKHTQHLSLIHI